MTLVFATSRGVVMAAAVPPAIAPHTAPCHGSRGDSCNLLSVDCGHEVGLPHTHVHIIRHFTTVLHVTDLEEFP